MRAQETPNGVESQELDAVAIVAVVA